MGILDTVLGAAKLATNFLGGGSGTKTGTTQSSSQNQKQTQVSNSSGSTTASRREFSDGFLQQLELATAESLKTSNANQVALEDQMKKVQGYSVNLNFNPDDYVNQIVGSARDAIQRNTTQSVNQLAGNTGGSTSGNSAAALLASRVANEGASTLANTEATARGTAAQIQQQNEALRLQAAESQTNQLTGITSTVDASLTALLNALKGGETAQDVSNTETATVTTDGTITGTGTSTSRTPFNWTAGLGNLFKDIGQA